MLTVFLLMTSDLVTGHLCSSLVDAIVECVTIFTFMQDKSGVALVAHEKFLEPKEVEVSFYLSHTHTCPCRHTHYLIALIMCLIVVKYIFNVNLIFSRNLL